MRDKIAFKDLKEMITRSSANYKDKLAFRGTVNNQGRDVSYNELFDEMNALGTKMIDLGLEKKYIAVVSENRYEWALSYLATVNGVGIIVPLDSELSYEEMGGLLNECEASMIIYSKKLRSKVEKALEGNKSVEYKVIMDDDVKDDEFNIYNLIESGREDIKNGNNYYLDKTIDENEFSVLLFTSGTTGFSKGVKLCHRNLATNVWSVWPLVEISEKDSLLSILPLHHTYECTCGMLVPLAYGACITHSRGLRHMAEDMKKTKPTVLITVPLITEKVFAKVMENVKKSSVKFVLFKVLLAISPLVEKVFGREKVRHLFKAVHAVFGGNLSIIISGASHISPKVASAYQKMGFYFLQGYGLTECAPLVLGNSIHDYTKQALGKPLPGVSVKLENKNEQGIGEIIVKGPNVMLGYFNQPEKTAEVLKDGWFHTGDMAKFKNDGFFYMTGRKKNIIVTKNGKNVYPEEIEDVLNKNLFVLESVVVSDHKRIKDGNLVKAIIHPNIEKIEQAFKRTNFSKIELQEILQKEIFKINRKMPTHKKIRSIQIKLDEFKKTTTKKIKRHTLDKDDK